MARYTFVQFNVTPTAGGTTEAYPNSSAIPVNEDLTIVAVYQLAEHTVTFQSSPPSIMYVQPSGQGDGSSLLVGDGETILIQVPNEVEI